MPHGFLSPSRLRCRNAGDAVPYDYYAGTCQPRRVRALFLRADRDVRPYGGASGTPHSCRTPGGSAAGCQTVKKPARLQVSERRIPSIGKGKHA